MRTNVAWKGMSLSMMGTKIVHMTHSVVQSFLVVDASRGGSMTRVITWVEDHVKNLFWR